MIDLAESLIKLGFARASDISQPITTDASLKNYIKKLKKAQIKASKRPLPWPINSIQYRLSRLIYDKVLPPKYRLPELVR